MKSLYNTIFKNKSSMKFANFSFLKNNLNISKLFSNKLIKIDFIFLVLILMSKKIKITNCFYVLTCQKLINKHKNMGKDKFMELNVILF